MLSIHPAHMNRLRQNGLDIPKSMQAHIVNELIVLQNFKTGATASLTDHQRPLSCFVDYCQGRRKQPVQ